MELKWSPFLHSLSHSLWRSFLLKRELKQGRKYSTAQIMGGGGASGSVKHRKLTNVVSKRWSSRLEKSFIPQTLQASQWRPELPVWVLPGSAATAQTERREGGGRNRRKVTRVQLAQENYAIAKTIHTMQRFDLTREHSNKTWNWKSCWSRNSFECLQQKMPQGELKQPWHARLQRHIPAWRAALFLPAKCKVTQYYCCHHLSNWQQQRWMSSSRFTRWGHTLWNKC